MKKNTVLILIAMTSAIISILFTLNKNSEDFLPVQQPTKTPAGKILSNAIWVSNAKTVDELITESDLIVMVRTASNPVTRTIDHEYYVFDENNIITGTQTSKTMFSDTIFEIIKTYYGKRSQFITVVQTGGYDPNLSNKIEEVADDPLYKKGEIYVLFLVDISGDPIQAPNKELYRIINPFARYRISGEQASSYGEKLDIKALKLPTTLYDLEYQITSVLSRNPLILTPISP